MQVTFGVVTSDVLLDLAGAEAQRGPATDRMAAIAGHLVAQRRCDCPKTTVFECAYERIHLSVTLAAVSGRCTQTAVRKNLLAFAL